MQMNTSIEIRGMTKLFALRALLCAALLSCLLSACATGPSQSDAKERSAKAQAMFAERCKTAGEKIYKTVDGVEGIFLLKLRPGHVNYQNQFALDDPYGRDLLGQGYIKSFIRGSYQAETSGATKPDAPPRFGYLYVEAVDPKDGKRYRYTGEVREHEATSSLLVGGTGKKFKTTGFVLDKVPAPGAAPRYGVTYDDISTHEEREYWIAGSSLKLVDLQTNEVVAERVGYMIDLAQGNTAGGRSPWLYAADHACPKFSDKNGASAQGNQTLDFAEKVLKPKN
jgi:hypothetical protein